MARSLHTTSSEADMTHDMNERDGVLSSGRVCIDVEESGRHVEHRVANTVMAAGRSWLARVLANQLAGNTDFWVSHMAFGSGGYNDNDMEGRRGPLEFDDGRTSLFSPIPNATVTCTPSPVQTGSYRVTFTGRLAAGVANGYPISEMGLMMKNGTMFAMVTFPPIVKTSSRVITVRWTISLLSGS